MRASLVWKYRVPKWGHWSPTLGNRTRKGCEWRRFSIKWELRPFAHNLKVEAPITTNMLLKVVSIFKSIYSFHNTYLGQSYIGNYFKKGILNRPLHLIAMQSFQGRRPFTLTYYMFHPLIYNVVAGVSWTTFV